jgi:GGDEF domain-containing protein
MIDLDRLKAINDRYGHRSGDRAIAAVGAALAELTRARDTLAALEDPERGRADRLSISWRVAAFAPPISLEMAIATADQRLYARKPSRV